MDSIYIMTSFTRLLISYCFHPISQVPLPHPEDTMTWNVGQIGRDQHLPPDMMDGQLTPLGKFQVMM